MQILRYTAMWTYDGPIVFDRNCNDAVIFTSTMEEAEKKARELNDGSDGSRKSST